MIAEVRRLAEEATREKNWKHWGPYRAERQWATVREDYSPHGTAWEYFLHEHKERRINVGCHLRPHFSIHLPGDNTIVNIR